MVDIKRFHRFACFLALLLLLVSSLPMRTSASLPEQPPQPPILVSIVTHNEEPPQYPDFVHDEAAFWQQRAAVVEFANMLYANGVMYNYQSDWNFLLAMTMFDQGTPDTNGKNLLRYLKEDLGFEVDPHAHETQYNYADVACLIDMLGVPPSHTVGGFLADPPENSKLEYLWEPLTGTQYPTYTWQAEILWGGGIAQHRNEEGLWTSGVWKPQDKYHFLHHSEAAPLPNVGNYGSNWGTLDRLIQKQQNGQLQPDKIHTATVFAGQSDLLTPGYIQGFEQEILAHNAAGNLRWLGLAQVIDVWHTEYGSEPNLLPFLTPSDPLETIPINNLLRGDDLANVLKLSSFVLDSTGQHGYVVGTLTPAIGVIDIPANQMVSTISTDVEGFVVKRVAVNTTTGQLYLLAQGSNILYEADLASQSIVRQTFAGPGSVAMTVDEAADRLYVAGADCVRVYQGDLSPSGIITPVVSPRDMEIDASAHRLYVVSGLGPSRGVNVYDTTTLALVRSYPVSPSVMPIYVHSTASTLYVTGIPSTLLLIDKTSGVVTTVSLQWTPGDTDTYSGKLYQLTGGIPQAGYLPDADGSRGIAYRRNLTTGAEEANVLLGFETSNFGLNQNTGRLYAANTGDASLSVVQLPGLTTLPEIDVGTSVEQLAVHPGGDGFYSLSRLGGSLVVHYHESTRTVTSFWPTNWPTDMAVDPDRNRLYVLGHYQTELAVFDTTDDSHVQTIDLTTPVNRTDALSALALDRTRNRAWAVFPETGHLAVADLNSGTVYTTTVAGYNPVGASGPGLLHLAVDESRNRVFVFLRTARRLNVYDATTYALLTTVDLSSHDFTFTGIAPLKLLYADSERGRLYVAYHILDADTYSYLGQLADGERVIGAEGDSLYVYDVRAEWLTNYEFLDAVDRDTYTNLDSWRLRRYVYMKASSALDFDRGLAYMGDFSTAEVDVYRLCNHPLTGVEIAGPANLQVGETALYSATYTPFTTTQPVTLTWDSGAVGPTAVYSWTTPGSYSVAVTATNPCGDLVSTTLAVTVCQPVEEAEITGPTSLPVGQAGLYSANYLPVTATQPVTVSWDNGAVGATAAYSWTQPGRYTVTVTATNGCGQAGGSLTVDVTLECQPVETAAISGPLQLTAGEVGWYDAGYLPVTATQPVTMSWNNGAVGATAAYSWTVPGRYTITVVAANGCGTAEGSLGVEVTAGCVPVESAGVTGPAYLPVGTEALYNASYLPLTATQPVTVSWDSGAVGATAVYSWTAPGSYTVTVTAANGCGQAEGRLVVEVTEECLPVESVAVSGPGALLPGEEGLYSAAYEPITASQPITLSWGNGALGPTAAYSWTVPGRYTVTITATGPCGEPVTGSAVVQVGAFQIYLPVVIKGS